MWIMMIIRTSSQELSIKLLNAQLPYCKTLLAHLLIAFPVVLHLYARVGTT